MATLGGDMLTLAEVAKRTDPDGPAADIAELLHQAEPVLDDIPMRASNLSTSNRSTIRTGLPTPSLRRINEGVASTRSTTSQQSDGMSIIEDWSTTDELLLEFADDPRAIRMGEAESHLEGMAQKMGELIWYGDESEDEKEYNGFEPRYASLSSGNTKTNVLDASGSTSNVQSSIWLIGWHPNKIHGIYPKNSTAGIMHREYDLQPVQDQTSGSSPAGAKLAAYQDQWRCVTGLVVKDWRYAVRICNVEQTVLKAVTGDQALTAYATNVLHLMAQAMHLIPNRNAASLCFYMPRDVMIGLDMQALARTEANVIQTRDVDGEMVQTFRGVPCKVSDQLLTTEAVVS